MYVFAARGINYLNNLHWIVLDSLSHEVLQSKLDAFSENKVIFAEMVSGEGLPGGNPVTCRVEKSVTVLVPFNTKIDMNQC